MLMTKNTLVARDLEIFREMAGWNGIQVNLSITSLDADLARRMEPRTASPNQRLETVRTLATAGIPTGVMIAPVIPGLTDTELPQIVQAAHEAGARTIHYLVLRLPYGVKDLFLDWVDQHYAARRHRI